MDDSDKADEKSDDKIEAEKIKNERSNRAFMRFRRNQEKKKDDDSNSFRKSSKVAKIAKDLEDTLSKRSEKETIEYENENNNKDKESRKRRVQRRYDN